MLSRLETMILMEMDIPLEAVQRQLASGIDIIIHLGRLRDKSRRVLEIVEVKGYEEGEIMTNDIFRFKEEGEKEGQVIGTLTKVGELTHMQKMTAAGVAL